MTESLHISVIGAGPAGLLFASLIKSRQPQHEVVVFEQNERDVTFGFGVVFSHGALHFFERDVPEIYRLLAPCMESWAVQKIVHRDQSITIDGNGFAALSRLTLLQLLQKFAMARGVELKFGTRIEEISDFDLVVGADGVNSVVRRAHADQFKPRIEHLTNRFAWYGTTRLFDCLTLTFRSNEHGV